ncbi:flap endonuclease 1 isoform X2 [Rhizophagus clarus]|nr:flap endonuclease 1 isoform X2 [Rhizophagus clarus]
MGVKNLTRLLQRSAPNSIKQKIIQDYKNKTLVLDGSIFLRRFVYSFRHENENEILHPHIYGFYKLISFLKQNSIKPILIFDGKKRINEKRKEIAKRKMLAEILLRNWNFEKSRKDRVEKWKIVVKKLNNLDETKYQYVTSGIKQVVGKTLSQPLPALIPWTNITSVPEVRTTISADIHPDKTDIPTKIDIPPTKTDISPTKTDIPLTKTDIPPTKTDIPLTKTDIPPTKTDISLTKTEIPLIPPIKTDISPIKTNMLPIIQDIILLVMYVMKALTSNHNIPIQIPSNQIMTPEKIKTKDSKATVEEKVKKAKKVTKEKGKVTTCLIDEPVIKTITNLKDEKKFIEIHPNFEPSESDVELKEDMEKVIKMSFQDTTKLATDKNFTKAQREVGLIEHLLINSVLSGNKNSENLKTFEALEVKNHNLAATYEKRVIPITWNMYNESIDFIRTWGIPCIVLDGHEAEAMCASLVTNGFADATVSEDMDTTVFGDGILLRQFFKKNKPIVEISPVEVKKSLELSHDQYIDLCILCGTDFAGTIRNVGPVTALKLIKQHGSIENILLNLKQDRYLTAPDYIVEVEAARKLYKNPPKITRDIHKQLESCTEHADKFNRLLEKFDIDSTINEEPLDYNVIVYDVNSAEDIDSEYLGPDPFSTNIIKTTEL